MYHLLVGVIAVAIGAALTLTGVFFLGPQFNQTTIKAHVTTMVNQAQQISAASTLYNVDEAKSTESIQELVDLGYLKELPARPVVSAEGAAWEITLGATAADRSYVHIELGGNDKDKATVCDIVAKLVGACEGSVYNYPL